MHKFIVVIALCAAQVSRAIAEDAPPSAPLPAGEALRIFETTAPTFTDGDYRGYGGRGAAWKRVLDDPAQRTQALAELAGRFRTIAAKPAPQPTGQEPDQQHGQRGSGEVSPSDDLTRLARGLAGILEREVNTRPIASLRDDPDLGPLLAELGRFAARRATAIIEQCEAAVVAARADTPRLITDWFRGEGTALSYDELKTIERERGLDAVTEALSHAGSQFTAAQITFAERNADRAGVQSILYSRNGAQNVASELSDLSLVLGLLDDPSLPRLARRACEIVELSSWLATGLGKTSTPAAAEAVAVMIPPLRARGELASGLDVLLWSAATMGATHPELLRNIDALVALEDPGNDSLGFNPTISVITSACVAFVRHVVLRYRDDPEHRMDGLERIRSVLLFSRSEGSQERADRTRRAGMAQGLTWLAEPELVRQMLPATVQAFSQETDKYALQCLSNALERFPRAVEQNEGGTTMSPLLRDALAQHATVPERVNWVFRVMAAYGEYADDPALLAAVRDRLRQRPTAVLVLAHMRGTAARAEIEDLLAEEPFAAALDPELATACENNRTYLIGQAKRIAALEADQGMEKEQRDAQIASIRREMDRWGRRGLLGCDFRAAQVAALELVELLEKMASSDAAVASAAIGTLAGRHREQQSDLEADDSSSFFPTLARLFDEARERYVDETDRVRVRSAIIRALASIGSFDGEAMVERMRVDTPADSPLRAALDDPAIRRTGPRMQLWN
ncbi:MAG: hypothetical protein U0575_09085 [Phycisphaerales bacterium]